MQGKTLLDMPICEEGESSPDTYRSPQHTPTHAKSLTEKHALIAGVIDAVEKISGYFASAATQSDLAALGDSALHPACAKLVLSTLCPAIYAVLSNGLKPNLETSFGPISNSVWQVVEASAQQGPLTKALNELVMRINGEDVFTEGNSNNTNFHIALISHD